MAESLERPLAAQERAPLAPPRPAFQEAPGEAAAEAARAAFLATPATPAAAAGAPALMPRVDRAARERLLLGLQREQGNGYVQRVVAAARAAAAARPVVDGTEPQAAGGGRPPGSAGRLVGRSQPEMVEEVQRRAGAGTLLPEPARGRLEGFFGNDLGDVRLHTGADAAVLTRELEAEAFTVGSDVFIAPGAPAPATTEGQALLAHEVAHVGQQTGCGGQELSGVQRRQASPIPRGITGLAVQRQPAPAPPAAPPSNLDRLQQLLDDDEENDAIALMGTLSPGDVSTVLSSSRYLQLAVSAFNNQEMYRAVKAMRGDLLQSLYWMFEEGTDWDKVKDILQMNRNAQERVRASASMKGEFVGLCGNDEMAEAVDLLGGDLAWKLSWMREEGASWAQVRAKIAATADQAQKDAVRADGWRAFLVDVCNDREMAEAVDLLGGDLAWKLSWMKEEGTNWSLVEAKLRACSDEAQKAAVRTDGWRGFFVDVCNNDEMGLAVQLLGGTLEWKLSWMKDEGVEWRRLVQVIAGCSDDAQKAPIRASDEWKRFFISNCNDEEMATVAAGLGGDLEWRLGWMRDEGSSWMLVARELRNCADDGQKRVLRESDAWRAFFVDICNNREMSEAVELLGGDLPFKLRWMAAEGADWPQVREKLAAAPEAQKLLVRNDPGMRTFLVETCGNDEMAEAVTLLGGDLQFKLSWMKEEGTDWAHVKATLAAVADDAQKSPLRTDAWKEFFVDVCGNAEMAEAVDLLGGDLRFKLTWMYGEGADWSLVKPKLAATTDAAQKQAVRDDTAMKAFFVDVCGNAEMAEAVDLLGGDLTWKLSWMKEEGTSWQLVRERLAGCTDAAQRQAVKDSAEWMAFLRGLCSESELQEANALLGGTATATLDLATARGMSWDDLKVQLLQLQDETKKADIRGSADWRDVFVRACGNDEMAQAVDLLGGDLAWKLSWMKEEGTDWPAVQAKIAAAPGDAPKQTVRTDPAARGFFVDLCNNREMAAAVTLLGGDLAWKLDWLLAEGTSADLVLPIVNAAPAAEKTAVGGNADLCRRLMDELGSEGTPVFEALGTPAFVAAALIDQGGGDRMIQALRVAATAPNVAGTIAELRGMGKWSTFLDGCPVGPELTTAAKPQLGVIYASLGAGVLDERKRLIRIRYHIEISDAGVGGQTATPWTQPALDAVYQILAQLPEGSVLSNDQIDKLHLVVSGIGTYYPAYDAIHLPGGGGYNMATAQWGNTIVVENHFQGTIRHEMGHAIDALVNGEAWYTTDPNIDWDIFGNVGDWVASVEALGGWGPVSDEDQRNQIRQVITGAPASPGAQPAAIAPADPNHPFNLHAATCPIIQTASLNLAEGSHNNFMAMPVIGGKVFTRRPVYREFYSYNQAARVAPVWVSNYGLSAPADWFAEQIREYFRTTPPGANTAPFVANWFRMNLP